MTNVTIIFILIILMFKCELQYCTYESCHLNYIITHTSDWSLGWLWWFVNFIGYRRFPSSPHRDAVQIKSGFTFAITLSIVLCALYIVVVPIILWLAVVIMVSFTNHNIPRNVQSWLSSTFVHDKTDDETVNLDLFKLNLYRVTSYTSYIINRAT